MADDGEGTEGGVSYECLLLWADCIKWGVTCSDNSDGSAEETGWGLQPPSSSNNSLAMMLESTDQPEAAEEAPIKKRCCGGGGGSGRGRGGGGCRIGEGRAEVKKGNSGELDQTQKHLLTVRERRRSMNLLYKNLHAMIPDVSPKLKKNSIAEEGMKYIKSLEDTLHQLQQQKLERLQARATSGEVPSSSTAPPPIVASSNSFAAAVEATTLSNALPASRLPPPPLAFQTWTSSNVVLNICGDHAQINVYSERNLGLFSYICWVLEKYNIELVSSQVSSDSTRRMYMIQTQVNRVADDQTAEAKPPVEDIYKQAAAELSSLISSSS